MKVELTRDQISHISFALGFSLGEMGTRIPPDDKDASEANQKRMRAYAEIVQEFTRAVDGEEAK